MSLPPVIIPFATRKKPPGKAFALAKTDCFIERNLL